MEPTQTNPSLDRRVVAALGAGVGLAVACGAVGLDVYLNERGLVAAHLENPALWVTALMPVLLAILAWSMTTPVVLAVPPPPPLRTRTPAVAGPRMVPFADLERAETARDDAIKNSQAKSIFLASMSHELRTPLNAIIGYSEMMREDVDLGLAAESSDLVRVSTAARHLLQLINNILDLSKIGAGKMSVVLEPVGVAALLDEVSATIGTLASQNGNTFKIEARTKINKVQGDHMRLRQILINLLGNAFKFTSKGTVTLIVDIEERDGFEWALFAVQDDGIGMSQEQADKLFVAYAQADSSIKREFGGTGLGLSISQRLAEMMAGRIEVTSAKGEGSTFTLRLPILDKLKDTPLQAPPLRGLRVLVIDDDPVIEASLRRLRKDGIDVHAVRSGADGRELASGESFDAIIMDVQLEASAGWRLLSDLAADSVPVVVASVEDDLPRRQKLGAAAFVQKPLSYDEVLSALQRARAKG